MGLKPLEFVDCLSDSPYFRENLHVYERELERTSKAIKGLVAECKGLLLAAKNLSEAQKKFSDTLQRFEFNCIEGEQTEDEKVIAGSLKQFGKLISTIEDARARMVWCAALSGILMKQLGFTHVVDKLLNQTRDRNLVQVAASWSNLMLSDAKLKARWLQSSASRRHKSSSTPEKNEQERYTEKHKG